jgi:hypothetical protein
VAYLRDVATPLTVDAGLALTQPPKNVHGRLASVTLICLLALTTAQPAAASPLPPGQAQQLAERYAPVFHFSPREKFWPMSVDRFIQKSALVWRAQVGARNKPLNKNCDRLIVKRGKIAPSRLGSRRPYKVAKRAWSGGAARGECVNRGRPRFKANQFTRPFDTARKRPKGLGDKQGFTLDLSRTAYHQPKPGNRVPLYYQYGYTPGNGHWVRYFLMYGCSGPPGRLLDKYLRACWHEGEWEGLTVFHGESLQDDPEEVFYNEHHAGYRVVGWWNVLKRGEHPRVWVAENTHAGYPFPLNPHNTCSNTWYSCFGKDYAPDGGLTWRAHPARVINVRSRPWYGFGGSWGFAEKKGDHNGPSGPGHPIRASGFPSPWTFEPASFPSGNRRWCDNRRYVGLDPFGIHCIRDVPLNASESLKQLLDLDCPDATTGEDRLPEQFFGIYVNQGPNFSDPHDLDSDGDTIGCENERSGELLHWEWVMPTTPSRIGDLWLDFDARENQKEILMQIRFYVGDPAQCFAQVREYAEATARRAADGTYAASGTIKAEAAPGAVYSQGSWQLNGRFSAPGHFTGTITMNLTNDPSINGCAEPTETYNEMFDAVPSK